MYTSKPLISVIVPVYKVEKYLPACIESILAQTHENLEIILVDDGSPDNCGKICDSYAEKDSRIKVIRKENGGVSSARNAGLDIASGEYIGFVDSDDTAKPKMYERLYSELVGTGSDVSVCKARRLKSGAKEDYVQTEDIERMEMSREEAIADMIITKTFSGSLWNKLFKSELIKDLRFDEKICSAEDVVFVAEAFLNAERICYFSEELYNYYTREESATQASFHEKHMSSLDAFGRIAELLETAGLSDKMKKYTDASMILCNIILLRRLEGDKTLQKKYAPLFRKNLLAYLNKESFGLLSKSIKTNVVYVTVGSGFYFFALKVMKKLKKLR